MDHSFSNTCKWVQNEKYINAYTEKLKEARKELDTIFEDLRGKAEDDICPISKDNVIQESTANISKYQRWLDRLFQAKIKLHSLKGSLSRMESELFHYYRNNSDISDKIKSDSATQRYIDGNKCRNALKEYILNNEAFIEFIEGTTRNLHNRNFAIKNIIEAWSHELGLL